MWVVFVREYIRYRGAAMSIVKAVGTDFHLPIGLLGSLAFILFSSVVANATEPPPLGADWPSAEIAERFQNFTTKRGFLNLTRIVVANQAALAAGLISPAEADAKGGTIIKGRKAIPVLLLKFSDTTNEPYPPADLQKQLF